MLVRVCKEFHKKAQSQPNCSGDAFNVISLAPVKEILDRWQTFGAQQDAGEFLFYILNGMHEECKWKTNDISMGNSHSDYKESDNGWAEVGKSNRKVEVRCSGL